MFAGGRVITMGVDKAQKSFDADGGLVGASGDSYPWEVKLVKRMFEIFAMK